MKNLFLDTRKYIMFNKAKQVLIWCFFMNAHSFRLRFRNVDGFKGDMNYLYFDGIYKSKKAGEERNNADQCLCTRCELAISRSA